VRHSGIAIVVASALALAACGSGGSTSDSVTKTTVPVSRKIVLTSIMTTAAAKTARIDLEVSISGGDSDGSARVTGEGVVDFATGDSEITTNLEGVIGSVVGDGYQTRTVDGVVYVQIPAGLRGVPVPEGTRWISIDVSQFGGGSARMSPFDLSNQADPTKALAYLEKVSNDVRAVGSDSIRGADTTHYHATIDLAKTVDGAHVPPGWRDTMKQFAGLIGTIPADVWIDADGLVRRERIEIDFGQILHKLGAPGTTTDHSVMTETLDYYDFGTPVNVEAPPADQVAPFPFAGGPGSLEVDGNA